MGSSLFFRSKIFTEFRFNLLHRTGGSANALLLVKIFDQSSVGMAENRELFSIRL